MFTEKRIQCDWCKKIIKGFPYRRIFNDFCSEGCLKKFTEDLKKRCCAKCGCHWRMTRFFSEREKWLCPDCEGEEPEEFEPKQVEGLVSPENVEVGMGATMYYLSDCHAYEVVEVTKSKKIAILRLLDAEWDENNKPEFTPGGFVGHCSNNQDLKWRLFSNPENSKIRVHWRPKKKQWSYGGTKVVIGKAVYHYDFNL